MTSGFHINLIGPPSTAIESLNSYFQAQDHIGCSIVPPDQLSRLSLDGTANLPTLSLLDSQDQAPGYQPLDVFNACRRQAVSQPLFAFFNCNPGSELEMLAGNLNIHGLFYDDASQEMILKGVMAMFEGDLWLPRRILAEQLQRSKMAPLENFARNNDVLTNREIEILNLIATGAKNTDIAQQLSLSVHTIKTHIYHIYKKIDVSNRMQAVNWASQNL